MITLCIGKSSTPRDEENGRIYSIKTHQHGQRKDDEIKEKNKSYLWIFISLKISDRFIYPQPIKQFTTSLHQSASTLRDEENGHNYSIKSTSTRRAQGRRNRRKNKSYLWPVISLKISIIFVYKQSKGVRRSTPWQFKLCITG